MSTNAGADLSGRSETTGEDQAVAVEPEWLGELATHTAEASQNVAQARFAMLGYLHSEEVALALRLDPLGGGEFDHALRLALDGTGGLGACAAQADDLRDVISDAIRQYEHAEDGSGGWHLPGWAGGLWSFGAHVVGAQLKMPLTILPAGRDLLARHYAAAASDIVLDDPDLVSVAHDILNLDAAQMSLVLGQVEPSVEKAASHIYDDGSPVSTALGSDTQERATAPPRTITDVLDELALRNEGSGGSIDVRIIRGEDGRRAAIVDITGTKSWNLAPHSGNVAGVASNLRSIDGARTSYELGVLDALERAGVRPDEPVMLVGHSLGGMIAVNAARTAVSSGRFNVTHVLTAGAPIGRTVGTLPRSVQVLALENTHDLVPRLDDKGNTARRNVTTLREDEGGATVGDAHDLDHSYLPIAKDADASSHDGVRRFVETADEFFDGAAVDTQRFIIGRSPS
ncbi:MAG TPA: hypothetical protein VGL26_04110 [Jatrophihabitans sp.]